MIRRPPRSTLFPYTNALPIWDLKATTMGGRIPAEAIQHIRERASLVEVVSDVVTLRSEEHTSELQSQSNLVCRLLLEKKKKKKKKHKNKTNIRKNHT